MALGGSSSSTSTSGNSLNVTLSDKLTGDNFLLWQIQILPDVRGAQLEGYLDGSVPAPDKELKTKDKDGVEVKIPNPEYARWISQDQQLLGYLLRNMSREVLTQMVGQTTSAGVWKAVTEMFSSQSKARVVHLRTKLNQTRKENKTGAVYFGQIKSLADEMATAGKPLDTEDIISYVLAGLDDEYNGFVAAITVLLKAQESISLGDLYAQFLSYEAHLESQNPAGDSSVNVASRGGGRGYRGGYDGGCGGGRGGYSDQRGSYDQRGGYESRGYDQRDQRNKGNGNRNNYQGNRQQQYGGRDQQGPKPICQVCGKEGHTALNCWKRFQKSYHGPEKSAGAAVGSYGVDTNWYSNSGATDHVASDLDKLHVRDRYNGNEKIHTASGAGSGHEGGPSSR